MTTDVAINTASRRFPLFQALQEVAGQPGRGDIAFLRTTNEAFLTLVAEVLSNGPSVSSVAEPQWAIYYVGSKEGSSAFTTADFAVELRERKKEAIFLIIDLREATTGLDGIYSSGKEVDESEVLEKALDLLLGGKPSVVKRCIDDLRRAARRFRRSRDLFTELRFVEGANSVAAALETCWMLGLWPIGDESLDQRKTLIDFSVALVRDLVPPAGVRFESARSRLDRIGVDGTLPELLPVVRLIEQSSRMAFQEAYERNPLPPEFYVGRWALLPRETQGVTEIRLMSWRKPSGDPNVWSGLQLGDSRQLELVLDLDGKVSSDLVIRWQTTPKVVPKHDVTFTIEVVVGDTEVLLQHEQDSAGKDILSARFRPDEFDIEPNDYYEAFIRVRAGEVEATSDEGFVIRSGIPAPRKPVGAKRFRCLAEFLGQIGDSALFEGSCDDPRNICTRRDGQIDLQVYANNRTFKGRITEPGLWSVSEKMLLDNQDALGYLVASVHANGRLDQASVKFVALSEESLSEAKDLVQAWSRLARKVRDFDGFLCFNLANSDSDADAFARLWNQQAGTNWEQLSKVNTLQLFRSDGRLLGVVLLPLHPLRLAFRMYYDSFVRYLSFDAQEVRSTKDRERLCNAVSGNMFPAIYPLVLKDGDVAILQAASALDISAQLLIPPNSVDPNLDERTIRRLWCRDLSEYVAKPDLDEWRTRQLASEIAGVADPKSGDAVLINNFAGGDGSQLAAALAKVIDEVSQVAAAPGKAMDDVRSEDGGATEEQDPNGARFIVRHYPSIRSRESNLDQLAMFFADLWELGEGAQNAVPESFRWIFADQYGKHRFDHAYPLVWSKQSDPMPADLDLAHISVINNVGICEPSLAKRSDLSKLERITPLFGLVPSWVHEFVGRSDSAAWIDYVPSFAKHERFMTRRPDSRLEDALDVVRSVAIEALGGDVDKDWPVVIRRLEESDISLLRSAHASSEKVVLLTSHALDIYRNGTHGFEPRSYLASEMPGGEVGGTSSGVSAVRLTSILAKGYLNQLEKYLDVGDDETALQDMLSRLEEVSLHRSIEFTDRNVYAPLALAVASFAKQFSVGGFASVLPARDQSIVLSLNDLPSELRLSPHKDDTEPEQRVFEDLLMISARANRTILGVNLVRVLPPGERFEKQWISDYEEDINKYERCWAASLEAKDGVLRNLSSRIGLAEALARALEGRQGSMLRGTIRQNFERRLDGLRSVDPSQVVLDIGSPEGQHLLLHGDATFDLGTDAAEGRVLTRLWFVSSGDDRMAASGLFSDCTSSSLSTNATELNEIPKSASETSPDLPHELRNLATNQQPSDRSLEVTEHQYSGDPLTPTQSHSSTSELEGGVETDAVQPPRIVLGDDNLGREATWEPRTTANPHLILTGQSGMGKTTVLLNAAIGLWESGVVPVVVSFHADIDEAVEKEWGETLQVSSLRDAKFNPLRLTQQEMDENPDAYVDSSFAVRDLFSAIFPTLGDIQLAQIREAVVKTYVSFGWASDEGSREVPSLQDVYGVLKKSKDTDRNLMARLEEIFAYKGLFQGGKERSFLQSRQPVLFKLSGSKLDTLQNAAVMFALRSIYAEMFHRGIQRSITHVIVIDEAHRLSGLKLLAEFAREARKYGIALLLASQRISDFSDDLLSNFGSLMFFKSNEDDAKVAGRYLGNVSEARGWGDQVKALAPHRAVYKSGEASPRTIWSRALR